VIVAAAGNYGKPRPAVIVQTDALPLAHESVIICQMTSDLADAPDFRVMVDPHSRNGLREPSHIMADKPVTVRRARIVQRIGQLTADEIIRLDVALAFVIGLAD